jgi:transcriptional regulator with XRE-family HTH domain
MDRRQMTPAQCRAARALIDMTQAELAGAAVVPTSLIADYETGANTPRQADLEAIQAALERAGVELIDGDRPGVRLGKRGK